MIQKILIPLVLALAAGAAEKATPSQLLQMAKKDPHSASFRETLLATATADAVQKGTAFVGEGPDFLFAVESPTKPQIIIDDKPGPAMSKLKGR